MRPVTHVMAQGRAFQHRRDGAILRPVNGEDRPSSINLACLLTIWRPAHYGQVYTRGISRIRRGARRRVHARPRCRAPADRAAARRADRQRPPLSASPISIVVNARVYTSDAATPRAEAFAVKHGRFVGGRVDERHPQPRDAPHAGDRRAAHDRDAGVHRRALPSERRQRAVRRQHQPAHRARDPGGDHARRRTTTPPGFWVTGFMFDDTKLRSAADAQGSRRGVDASTRCRWRIAAATRTSTTARRSSWPASPTQTPDPDHGRFFREQRRAERPRRRERARRVRPRRQARDVHAGAAARARAQGHGAHVEAVQRRRASRRCTTPARAPDQILRLRGLPRRTAS